jgi:hypothetical protein
LVEDVSLPKDLGHLHLEEVLFGKDEERFQANEALEFLVEIEDSRNAGKNGEENPTKFDN